MVRVSVFAAVSLLASCASVSTSPLDWPAQVLYPEDPEIRRTIDSRFAAASLGRVGSQSDEERIRDTIHRRYPERTLREGYRYRYTVNEIRWVTSDVVMATVSSVATYPYGSNVYDSILVIARLSDSSWEPIREYTRSVGVARTGDR